MKNIYTWAQDGSFVNLYDGIEIVCKVAVEDAQPIREITVEELDAQLVGTPYFTGEIVSAFYSYITSHDMELQEYLDCQTFAKA